MKKFLLILFIVLAVCRAEKLYAQVVSSVSLLDPTDTADVSITLNATINTDASADVNYSFEYGTTSGGPYTTVSGSETAVNTSRDVSEGLINLTPGEQYFYRFTATTTSPASTQSTAESSFWTLATQPLTPVSNFQLGENRFTDSIYFTFNSYTFPTNGGFVLYYKEGNSPEDLSNLTNGSRPTGQIPGDNFVFEPDDTKTVIGTSGLDPATEYSFILPIYNSNGNDDETIHYLKSGAPTGTYWTLSEAPAGITTLGTETNIAANSVDLDWGNVTGATGYLVIYTQDQNAIDTEIDNVLDGTTPNDLSFSGIVGTKNVTNSLATLTGLQADRTYYYYVIPYAEGADPSTINYVSKTAPNEGSFQTSCITPTETVSNLQLGTVTSNSIQLTWDDPDSLNVLVAARLTGETAASIVDGQIYNANSSYSSEEIGSTGNYVVFNGAGTGVNVTSLSDFEDYTFDVYLYNDNGECYGSKQIITQQTNCDPATTTVSGEQANNVSSSQLDVEWSKSSGAVDVLVVARLASSAVQLPSLNTNYDVNSSFGDGGGTAQTGTGNFVVYSGSGTSVTITNLAALTDYAFDIYEYNPNGFCYNTDKKTVLSTTDCAPPDSQSSFNTIDPADINPLSIDVSWTSVTGADKYLVVVRQGNPVNFEPDLGTAYETGVDSDYSQAVEVRSGGNNAVYNGTTNSVSVSGLNINTQYYFAVFAYNSNGYCYVTPASPGTATATTDGVASNNTLTFNGAASTISSVDNDDTGGNFITVLDFDAVEGGNDGVNTKLEFFTFSRAAGDYFGSLNIAWSDVIAEARLVNVTRSITQTSNITVNNDNITVDIPSNENDNDTEIGFLEESTSLRFQLQVRLNEVISAAEIDNKNLVFELAPADVLVEANSTKFDATSPTISSGNGNNEIVVEATEFEFTADPPAAVNAGENVTPQAIVEAKDANGNLDLDYGVFSITNADNIPMSNLPLNPSFTNGEFEFPANFNYQGSGDGTLTVTDGSSLFDVSSTQVTVNPTLGLAELTNGLNSGTLQSGATDQALLGLAIDALGTTQMQAIEFSTNLDLSNKVNNIRLAASADNTYDGTITDAVIASSPTIDNGANTITFTGLTENLSSETKNYFLIVDVDNTVNEFDTPDLTVGLDIAHITFTNSANINASNFSKTYAFEDITKPEVSQVTASPTVLSGAHLGTDALEIQVTFNEEMDNSILFNPEISFPNEHPITGGSLAGPNGTGGWSAGNTVYTFFFDLSDQDELVENIDVLISNAADISGNQLDDATILDLFTIDTENPKTVNVSLNKTLVNRPQNTIELSVKFDKSMNNTIDPTVEANTSNNLDNNNDGVWTEEVVGNGFNIYTVSLTHDLTVEEEISDKLLISGATDMAGNIMDPSESNIFNINTSRPRLESITASNVTGTYKAGDIIYIEVYFDQDMKVVSGTPELSLNSGGTAVFDNVSNNILTFNYEVLAGENVALLNVNAFNLEGASVTNTIDNEAVLTLPTDPADELSTLKPIKIDTRAPEISSTTITPSTVSQTNSTFTLEINYDEDMDQSSTHNFSFSNSSNISFQGGIWLDAQTYEADFEHDLLIEEEFDNVIIEISGATDLVGNTAVTADSDPFDIDTQSPRITEITASTPNGTYGPGDNINIKVVFDEAIQQIGTAPTLTLNTGATATFDNITNGNELNFTYTIGATASGENATDLNVTAISNSQIEILDLVNNSSVLTLPTSPNRLLDNSDLIIDTTSPTLTIGLDKTVITRDNNQLILTATYNEDMDQNTTPNFSVQGSNNLILDNGSWNSATEYIATFIHNPTEEEIQNVTIEVSGATDLVGNTAITNTSGTFTIDTQRPRILEIVSASANGLYSPGDNINIQLVFDEDVTVGGNPLLDLNSSGQASFQSVTNGNEVNFVYTVGGVSSGENTLDLDVNAFDMNGGNIRDLVSNEADIVLPADPNRLQDNADIQVDSDPADIVNVTATTDQGFFTTGDQIGITIEFDETVKVSGIPLLTLNTGSNAEYVSGSNSTILTFNYTVEASDGGAILDVTDLEYATVNSIDLNGGTIEDLAGINASLGLPAVGSANSLSGNTDITIDTQDPELANDPFTPFNGEFNVSHSLTFTIELNEPVSGQGTNNISIIDKQTLDVLAVLDAGTAFTNNTSSILEFSSFGNILEDSTEYYIQFDAGALVDRAGNEFAGFTADNIWSFTTFGPARIDNFSIGACVGETFTIQGEYFTGVSRIRTNINGASPFTISTFIVVDDETIEFTVPAGTVPGTITLDKQTGQAGNTENASTTSVDPIKVGPSSAQLALVEPTDDAICDIDDLGNVIDVEFSVDIVGGSGVYTLVYQVNTNDPITITGYEEGQTFSIVPPDSAENNVRIVSLTDEDDDLNTCSAPDLGSDVEVVKYIRSRVDAGGFQSQDEEFGVIELCGANTSVIDFSDLSLVTNSPEITGTVQQGTWSIDEGPSSNGGGFSPDFTLKSVQTDRPDTVKYYASFADGVRGEIVLELTSDDPGGLNPCVGTSDFVTVRFVESISVNSDRNVAICLDEDENGNQIAIASLSSTVSGGSASDDLSVEWTRVDDFNEEAGHDGTWGFKDDEDQVAYSLTSNVLNPIYKASPQEMLEGRSTLEVLPVLVSGVGCGAIPAPREVNIRINDIPDPTKSSGPEIICAGEQEVRFRMNATSPGNTFQWSFTNGLNQFDGATNSNLVFVNFREVTTETTDTLVVQELNPNTGCISKPDTFFIALKPLPIANIKYNSTTTISNTTALIPLEGEGGTAGNLVDATSENGQFSGKGVIQNSNGDYFLDSSQLGVTDITDEEDVHEVFFTFTNEFGCSATDTIAFNVFDAERIFPALAEEYCQLDAADTISVDNAIVPDGFIVSAINGPGITEIGYTDVVVGNDTISVLRAIFDPETAYESNPNSENPSVISITYSIEDPNDASNNADNVGEQIVIVNPLPVLEIDDIEAGICTYDEKIEFEPIGITGNNYSFQLINEGLPDSLVIGDSLDGFEFDPAPLLAYLVDNGEDSIRIFINYTYQDGNSCENSREYNFLVWRQPSKPVVNSTDLCFVDGVMDTAIVENYDGDKANEELLWFTGTDFNAEPIHQGRSYSPTPDFFTTVDEITFNVIRRNVDSEGEEEVPCVSNATEVTFRKIDNPDFDWNKSTFGQEPIIFTGKPNQAALASTEWTITNISGEVEQLVGADAFTKVNDSTIAVDFNSYGAGRYRVNFNVSSLKSCSAEVSKEIVILPEETVADRYVFNFDTSSEGWVSNGFKRNTANTEKRLWDFAIPSGESNIESNEHLWITNAEGSYESGVVSYVYSPSMDISNIDRPVVSFDLWQNMAEGDDGLILEYSTDGKVIEDPEKEWRLLGDVSSGLQWYNDDRIESQPGTINLDGINNNGLFVGWSEENDAESIVPVNAKHSLEALDGSENLIFRFQFKSTLSESEFGNRDGAAFDNFKIESLNRNVLVEYFGDFESSADPQEMETINSVFNDVGNFAWINYRINENDPLYKQASSSMLSRIYYYEAYSFEDQFAIDGAINDFSFAGEDGDSDFGINELSRARLFSSISSIDVEASKINESELEIVAKFNSVEPVGENVNLFIAVLQKEIIGGEQGTEEGITYHNVLRKLLPGNGGAKVSGTSGQQTVTFKASSSADENPLAVVAFLQNINTKAVIQSAYLGDLPLLSLSNVTALNKELGALNIELYPNPAHDFLKIQLDSPLQEEVKAKVIDVTGKTIIEFSLLQSQRYYEMKTSSLKTGMYNLILTNQNGERKMMKFAVTN
ncbi:hypothetical protein MATR_01870 [Marivirga tractuosa]|uniref:Fibronectin type III domain protein n=1 Tax=Marivirga tractuosa (strain ATCC 23168 / DSM 4126 / NBRC 15989 / NCIMB 1408 / VKM B-1430 / H-43) TaxID=643867 RepID=E4TVS6_MARTH|nr:T9SS type A sorting domain-containing protein [Marivirga tractuosa]ADR22174.1 Fibronectin type III domain protein [Marivirga tractuosa DSM 4126]BDD13362.1 hypothetical protein MATR_01870 [Marivirga tractuosa]